MADYDIGQVALLVVGAVVAWEGFYMVFKAVAVGGASFHPFFSGGVGAIVGLVMFVVGSLIAYGTYLEIGGTADDATGPSAAGGGSEATHDRPAARAANTTIGDDGTRERGGRTAQDDPEPREGRPPEDDRRPGDRTDRAGDRGDRSVGTDDRGAVTDATDERDDFARIRDEGSETRGGGAEEPGADGDDPDDGDAFVDDFDLSDVERE